MGKVADDHTSWGVAVEFHNAARVYLDYLETKYPREAIKTFTGMPVNFLMCHSLESVLKGYCYLLGDEESDLRKQSVRHNLKALLERAKSKGETFTEYMEVLVDNLNEGHLDHSNRYLRYNKGMKPIDCFECIVLLRNEIEIFFQRRRTKKENNNA